MMSSTEKDCELVAECQGTLLYNESLAEYTTRLVGGPAAKLYKSVITAGQLLFLRNLLAKRIQFGALVSQKHANFIINYQGLASVADIEALIHLVQTKVREQTTIELMREVHIIGDA